MVHRARKTAVTWVHTVTVCHDNITAMLWVPPKLLNNIGDDYDCPAWNEGERGYLNRFWCLLEMWYNACVLRLLLFARA